MSLTPGLPAAPWIRAVAGSLIALALGLLIWEIPRRGIDPDELEHLHAGFCVAQGQVPYRDFFEHHGPALYYLTWPLFKLHGATLAVLWSARWLMLTCSALTLWLTARLTCRCAGPTAGWIAGALLAWTTIFQAKAMELRPDVPAMLALVLAVSLAVRPRGGAHRSVWLAMGALCGLALLFTQKSLVPTAGLGLAVALGPFVAGVARREQVHGLPAPTLLRQSLPLTTSLSIVALFAAGTVAVWGAATLGFATAGSARQFWHATWYQLWLWPIRSSRWDYLRPTLAGDLTVWCGALTEIVHVAVARQRTTGNPPRTGVLAMTCVVCLAAIPFVKATYPQFYLLWMPLLAALAGARLAAWSSSPCQVRHAVGLGLLAVGLAGLQWFLGQRAAALGATGALPHLASLPFSSPLLLAGIVVALIAVCVLLKRGSRSEALLALGGLGMLYGGLRNVDLALWSNREQVARIELVHQQIPEGGRVLDGFTGLAALRSHAWYYWWINPYSLALISPHDREAGLLAQLQANPPAAVLFDANLELLPEPVRDWIHRRYAPTEPVPLWLPKPFE